MSIDSHNKVYQVRRRERLGQGSRSRAMCHSISQEQVPGLGSPKLRRTLPQQPAPASSKAQIEMQGFASQKAAETRSSRCRRFGAHTRHSLDSALMKSFICLIPTCLLAPQPTPRRWHLDWGIFDAVGDDSTPLSGLFWVWDLKLSVDYTACRVHQPRQGHISPPD